MDTTNIVLLITLYLFAILELILAIYILALDPRAIGNRYLSVILSFVALITLVYGQFFGATSVTEVIWVTYFLTFAIYSMVALWLLVSVILLKPEWLAGRWHWILYGLVLLPFVIILIDLLSSTQLLYTGLEPATYKGGAVAGSEYRTGLLAPTFDIFYMRILSIVNLAFTVYVSFFAKNVSRNVRNTARALMAAQLVLFIVQFGLSDSLDNRVRVVFTTLLFGISYGVIGLGRLVSEKSLQRVLRSTSIQRKLQIIFGPLLFVLLLLGVTIIYTTVQINVRFDELLSTDLQSLEPALATIENLRAFQITAGAVFAGVVFLLSIVGVFTAIVLGREIVQSMDSLQQAAEQLGAGNLAARAEVQGQDEMAVTANALNKMAAQLQDLLGNLEEQVKERTQQLATLVEVGGSISQVLELAALIQTVVSLTKETFGYYHVHIYLLDETGETLLLAEGYGTVGVAMKGVGHQIPLNQPQSLVAQAARSRQVTQVDNVPETPGWIPNDLLPETNAEMAVPIVSAGQVVGVLAVQSERVAGLDESDATLLQLLANQIAIAIRNAQLFTQNEEARQQAEAAQQAAEIASRAKSDFLSSMSHELRTPLNGILGYAQILQRDPVLTAQQQNGVQVIESSGQHLLSLINDVLDLAKIEAGRMDLIPHNTMLSNLLSSVQNIMEIRAMQKDLAYEQQTTPALPTAIYVDEQRLQQVLINLIGNAIKFTDEGQITLKVSLLAAAEETGTCRLRFAVRDTGIGMTADELSLIFTQFERVGSQQRTGTGLGLAISQQLVQAMGGDLLVESEPGVGSTFWLDIEVPVGQAAASQLVTTQQKIIGYRGARKKIMVVDDKETNRKVLCDLLEPLGFDLVEAHDGSEAVDLVSDSQPDLILMDLVMPRMSGVEATRRIRQTEALPAMPIIAASASAFDADKKEAIAVGCNAFLPKPIDAQELFAVLQTYLTLAWTYTEVEAASPVAAIPHLDAPLVIPPQEALASLYDLAQRGNLRAIENKAAELLQADAGYESFARHLQKLVEMFEMEKIKEFIAQYLSEES